jgi:hypothetical protein
MCVDRKMSNISIKNNKERNRIDAKKNREREGD